MHLSTISKKLLNSCVSLTRSHNMLNVGPLTAEIRWRVWGTPAHFNGFRVLASLPHRASLNGCQPNFARCLALSARHSRSGRQPNCGVGQGISAGWPHHVVLPFLITCDKPLQTFLEEKGKLSLKEMTQTADNYVEAHGHEINRSETKQNRWDKSNTVGTHKAGQNVVRANTVTCRYCNMNGHTAENCRKRQTDCRPVRSDIICFKRGKQGHRQFSCLNSSEKSQ